MRRLLAAAALLVAAVPGQADIRPVSPGESIQAAIDDARPGDVVQLSAGVYVEDLDFRGKPVTVAGAGPRTMIRGTGAGPVVRFVSGESRDAVLDSLTITGGVADRGGGILVSASGPTIRRIVVTGNVARRQGSGILLERDSALITNTLVTFNRALDPLAGDPHSIQLVGSSALLVNDTIAHGDSNGLLASGGAPTLLNNLIARNGSRVAGETRGRGICDFSAGAVLRYNLFHRNRRAAVLGGGRDFRRVRTAERVLALPRLAFNLDGSPAFADARSGDFRLTPERGRARDAGDPDPAFADRDGSRNDVGFTGGPLAPEWSADDLAFAHGHAAR